MVTTASKISGPIFDWSLLAENEFMPLGLLESRHFRRYGVLNEGVWGLMGFYQYEQRRDPSLERDCQGTTP